MGRRYGEYRIDHVAYADEATTCNSTIERIEPRLNEYDEEAGNTSIAYNGTNSGTK